jgi:uncharacterized protein with PQ loop repeat
MISFLTDYFSNFIIAVKHESIPILIGDLCILTGFIVEGIGIVRSKHISKIFLYSYLFVTAGTVLWFVHGVVHKDYWIMTQNGVAGCVQFTVLIIVFYLVKIVHKSDFAKKSKDENK